MESELEKQRGMEKERREEERKEREEERKEFNKKVLELQTQAEKKWNF